MPCFVVWLQGTGWKTSPENSGLTFSPKAQSRVTYSTRPEIERLYTSSASTLYLWWNLIIQTILQLKPAFNNAIKSSIPPSTLVTGTSTPSRKRSWRSIPVCWMTLTLASISTTGHSVTHITHQPRYQECIQNGSTQFGHKSSTTCCKQTLSWNLWWGRETWPKSWDCKKREYMQSLPRMHTKWEHTIWDTKAAQQVANPLLKSDMRKRNVT